MKVIKDAFLQWLDTEIEKSYPLNHPRYLVLKEVRDKLMEVIRDEFTKLAAAKKEEHDA